MNRPFIVAALAIGFANVFGPLALAVDPQPVTDTGQVLEESRNHPDQTYVITVGAEWCPYCKRMEKELRNYSAEANDAVTQSQWGHLDVTSDEPEAIRKTLENLKKLGVLLPEGIPYSIVVRGGATVGTYSGADLHGLKDFIGEVSTMDPALLKKGTESFLLPPSPCGPNSNVDVCVVGVSGYEGPVLGATDPFGMSNLKAFADLFGDPQFEDLYAQSTGDALPSSLGKGKGTVYVANPFKGMFSEGSAAPTFENLASVPQKNVRILLTGHGGPNGLLNREGGSNEVAYLDRNQVGRGLAAARAAGKQVQAVVTQCYGGDFGSAFAPVNGDGLSGCATFATLPSKLSEGCYSATTDAKRQDYFAAMLAHKKCDGTQNTLDLHYEVVATSKSHDVPMLSSEYFLTYGPAGDFLSQKAEMPARPKGTLFIKTLPDGRRIIVDLLAGRIMPLDFNQGLTLTYKYPSCARLKRSPPFDKRIQKLVYGKLLGRKKDCAPVVDMEYSAPDGSSSQQAKFNLAPEKGDILYDGTNESLFAPFPVSNSMPDHIFHWRNGEEKHLFSDSYWPIAQLENKKDFSKYLAQKLKALSPVNPSLASAISKLSKELKPTPEKILEAMNDAYYPRSEYQSKNIHLTRLAHLISVANLELDLRERAKAGESEAQKLAQSLDQMRECEKTIF